MNSNHTLTARGMKMRYSGDDLQAALHIAEQKFTQTRAIIFDLDGTLVEPFTSKPIPGRKERLAELNNMGVRLYIATNQGGAAYHLLYRLEEEDRAERYPDIFKIINRLEHTRELHNAVMALGALHPSKPEIMKKIKTGNRLEEEEINQYNGCQIALSWHPHWRKPNPGMLEYIRVTQWLDKGECLYIGNENTDMLAASAAGIRFMWAKEFFREEDNQEQCTIGSDYQRDDFDEKI